MARLKDLDWILPNDNGKSGLTWQQVQVALLMDLRDELQTLNRLLSCTSFIEIPRTLREIKRNTTKPKKKRSRS